MAEISAALYRAGEGEPLVLLHGGCGSWRHWQPVLGALAARFEVFAPTLAGHAGGPPFPTSDAVTTAAAADLLERHLDELGVDAAHFVGNSFGGALSIELAKRGRARTVIAISPPGGWPLDSTEGKRVAGFFTRSARLARAPLATVRLAMSCAQARRIAFREVMRHPQRMTPAEAVDMVRAMNRCAILDEIVTAIPRRGTFPQQLDRVAAPVLLLWGEHDRVLPATTCSVRYQREIPGAEFRVLPDAGHVPMWDAPWLIIDTIQDWIRRHTPVSTNQT